MEVKQISLEYLNSVRDCFTLKQGDIYVSEYYSVLIGP